VQKRIRKYYRRDSQIVHPPVDVNAFAESDEIDDYYLMVGELVGYKRPDLAVDAFNRNGKRLVVIGRGPMLAELKKMARPNVEILGAQPTDVLKRYYSRCKALIFPGEEDFGIVPLEAMASGRPVIAYGRGGALETVVDGRTGLLFEEQSVDCLDDALTRLDRLSLAPADLMAHARSYDLQRFKVEMRAAIDNVIRDTNGTPNRPVESTPFSQRGMAPRAFAFR
jgi:glycosyltransferase involved in cell wall biosynthesis